MPTLETARLRLRPHRPEDLDAAAAMWGDPVVTRFIGGKPATRAQTWMRMIAYRGQWEWLGFGYWAIEERTMGTYAGDVGFADFRRGLGLGMDGVPECGWALATAAHGRGYATEAVAAACAWGDVAFERGRTTCLIAPENRASIRVAWKCGFRAFSRGEVNGAATGFYERVTFGNATPEPHFTR